MKSKNIKIIPILVIVGFLIANLGFAVEIGQTPKAPETLEEAKTMGEKVLTGLPRALKEPWREALGIWGRMADIFSNFWNSYIFPWLKSIWHQITIPFKKEMERRQPIIEEEFKKEKKEIKEEIKEEIKVELPETTKSLWQRFKELIK